MWLEQCQKGKLLSEISTFGVGGPAKWFFEARTLEDLQSALKEVNQQKVPYILVGKGSNTLFDDRGFDGLVILNKIAYFEHNEDIIHVGAGYNFSLLGVQTARKGWSGLEFASGIPATVGGAIYMNAGANGKETCESLENVTYVNEEGIVCTYLKSELSFSYRFSSFQKMKGAIAGATFRLTKSETARKTQLDIVDYRMRTQPYGDKSAGCVFRNPQGSSAGALIDRCGLKGLKVGGAEVSTLHANFLINKNGATASDILELARLVKEKVFETTGIELEMEIRYQKFIQ
jgi:UDP-N-acetylmuramate dehydrogenase